MGAGDVDELRGGIEVRRGAVGEVRRTVFKIAGRECSTSLCYNYENEGNRGETHQGGEFAQNCKTAERAPKLYGKPETPAHWSRLVNGQSQAGKRTRRWKDT